LITHDRHLINQIANKVIEIDRGIPNIFLGNYDDYLYRKQQIQLDEVQEQGGAIHEIPLPLNKKLSYGKKEEKRKSAQQMDQFRRQLSSLEKRFQEVERSLHEATQTLDYLNQKLSDPNLYLNQKETYETIETHKRVKEQVRELTQKWEILAIELEGMKSLPLA
jgi:ATP-binding cassette subfamily F protein 3